MKRRRCGVTASRRCRPTTVTLLWAVTQWVLLLTAQASSTTTTTTNNIPPPPPPPPPPPSTTTLRRDKLTISVDKKSLPPPPPPPPPLMKGRQDKDTDSNMLQRPPPPHRTERILPDNHEHVPRPLDLSKPNKTDSIGLSSHNDRTDDDDAMESNSVLSTRNSTTAERLHPPPPPPPPPMEQPVESKILFGPRRDEGQDESNMNSPAEVKNSQFSKDLERANEATNTNRAPATIATTPKNRSHLSPPPPLQTPKHENNKPLSIHDDTLQDASSSQPASHTRPNDSLETLLSIDSSEEKEAFLETPRVTAGEEMSTRTMEVADIKTLKDLPDTNSGDEWKQPETLLERSGDTEQPTIGIDERRDLSMLVIPNPPGTVMEQVPPQVVPISPSLEDRSELGDEGGTIHSKPSDVSTSSESNLPGRSNNQMRQSTPPLSPQQQGPRPLSDFRPRSNMAHPLQSHRQQDQYQQRFGHYAAPPGRIQQSRSIRPQPPGALNSQRLPPQTPMKHTRRPRISSRLSTATWKRVWSKIEQGLDGLADLEDSVAGRAQELYSNTVSSVKVPVWKGSSGISIRPSSPPSHAKKQESQSEEPKFDLTRFQKKVAEPETKRSNQVVSGKDQQRKPTIEMSTNLYGDMYRKALKEGQQSSPSELASQSKSRTTQVESAVAKRLIRANGGASVPHKDDAIPVAPGASRGGPSSPGVLGPQRPPQGSFPVASSPRDAFGSPRAPNERKSQPPPRSVPPRPASQGQGAPRRRRPDFDDDEDISFLGKIGRFLPPIPRVSKISLNPFRRSGSYRDFASSTMDAWKMDDDEPTSSKGLFGLFKRQKDSPVESLKSSEGSGEEVMLTPSVVDLLDRCDQGESARLLTRQNEKCCVSVGRTRAVFDIIKLFSVLVIVRELSGAQLFLDIHSIGDFLSSFVPSLLTALSNSMDSWVPFALVAAFLAGKTDALVRASLQYSLSGSIAEEVKGESRYASLFLRLLTSSKTVKDIPDHIEVSVHRQVSEKVEIARLRFFVTCVLSALVFMTVSVLTPMLMASFQTFSEISSFEQWRHWPPMWKELVPCVKIALESLIRSLASMTSGEMDKVSHHPLKAAYEASIFGVIFIASLLPGFETRRKVQAATLDDDEDNEAFEAHERFTEQVIDLGGSSATRLDFLAEGSAIESLLERWKVTLPTSSEGAATGLSSSSFLRITLYNVLSGVLLFAPVVVFAFAGISPLGSFSGSQLHWDSLLDVSVVLFLVSSVVRDALKAAILSKDAERVVSSFLSVLSESVNERKEQLQSQSVNLQLQASVSPTSGILVKDLWAAHTAKRAWAVRGTNLSCRNGEIVMLLGDASSGKSRLLTTLAESIVVPPRRALSTTRVRGTVNFGGLDASKWDKGLLKKRVGVFLNDVRSVADISRVLSGLTLEEILEPSGPRTIDPAHNPGSGERSAMILALKITGLYSSLLPRLPSKLATVVTANEEDLTPSGLRPLCHMLSPVEWSKLLLAKVLAQTIFDNDNSAGNNDDVDQCLVGSFLLLDDVTSHFSEVDEARLLQDLRRTGAAVLISTNRWATGRFADRVAVLRDGGVVESGTHSELLNRGPQQSVYASKWHTMTTQ